MTTRELKLQDVLAEMAGAGDRWSQAEILRIYSRMIESTAFNLHPGCVSQTLDDLKQVASMCLIRLTQFYRVEGGSSFTTYATSYLAKGVRREVDYIDRPVSPSTNKLSEDRTRIKAGGEAEFILHNTTSINSYAYNDGSGEEMTADDFLAILSDVGQVGDNAERSLDAKKAVDALVKLSPMEQTVITMRLAHDEDFRSIGEAIGRSHQGAINLFESGIKKLRRTLGVVTNEPARPKFEKQFSSKPRRPRRSVRSVPEQGA